MQLIDMKNTPKEAKAETSGLAAPEYPWGLSLNLDKVALEKLGLDLPKVGTSFLLTARVDVSSANEYQSKDGTDCSCGLQVTAMALTTAGGSAKAAAKALYEPDGDEA